MISIISFGVAAFFSIRWLTKEIQNDYREKAILIGTHIIHDIGSAMISKIHGGIADALIIYRNHKEVEEVRLFNLRGDEILSKEIGTSEARVRDALRTGKSVYFQKEINQKKVMSHVILIKNESKCHGCHGKSEPFRGALLLSLNEEQMKAYVGQERQRFSLLFGLIAIVIIATTVVAINRLFLKPLGLIQKGTEAIGKGEFQYRVPVKSRDEIGILADNFNRMGQALQEKNEMLWEQVRLLSRSQKEWHETFDSITDLIAVIDKEFNITRANRAFHEYVSISSYAEINKKCYELLGTCLRPDCPHVLSMESKKHINYEIRDEKTGKVLDISYFPYYSQEGSFLWTILIAKDVTEKKETEMRLIMNERLAALGQMASGIAHEINNPLATIRVCAEGMLKRVKKKELDPAAMADYLTVIEEEITRCKNITDNMLSFVRKTDGKKNFNVNGALDKTLEMINFQGRLRDVEIVRNYQEEIPMLRRNEGDLRQVFLSIINNALDAMEEKGKLFIETGSRDNSLFIKIIDIGPGIPSSIIDKIFDPFFTTKAEKGGTGLGLSIANKIIKENNGKIDVSSTEGNGTMFMITIPI
jgi:PAS domain S-box-containing protein